MVGGGRLDRRLTLKNGGSLGKKLDPQTDGRWEVGPTYRSKAETFVRLHVAA